MKQAIAGVMPAGLRETTVMVVWPSIAKYASGRWLGRLFAQRVGVYVLTIGNLSALVFIPWALVLYFYRLARGSSYRLTNRRIIELRNRFGWKGRYPFFDFRWGEELRSVALDQFDVVRLVRQPGQDWYDAGDLVFLNGEEEVFRLEAVSRPEAFRQTCLKSLQAHRAVKQLLDRQAVPA
jgi:hypothetical protein